MSSSLFPYFLLLLLPIVFLILLRYAAKPSRTSDKLSLPPSPPSWPLLGHFFQLGIRNIHLRFAEFSRQYGPLVSLRLGTVLTVIASTPEAAAEILRTHDRILSGRAPPAFLLNRHHAPDGGSIVWSSECDGKWKSLRGICQTQMFSADAIQSQVSLREKMAAQMVEYLRSMEGQVVCITQFVSKTVVNGLYQILTSKDLLFFDDPEGIDRFRELVKSSLNLNSTPTYVHFCPWLQALDINGVGKKISQGVLEFSKIWEVSLKERRQSFSHQANHQDGTAGELHKDLLDCFLANNFADDKINIMFIELILAGTDATITTLEWALTELIRNRSAMQKLKQELSQALSGKGNTVQESLISDLPYLWACIKETFRLHPAVPLLVPHRAVEECKVMNYRIPRDSTLIINVWAIGRDPAVWEDPLCFRPERFLDCNIDFRGQDFELQPFGSGRRICPGYPLASKQIALLLASLVAFFDWDLPDGSDAADIDMNEKFAFTLCKEQPLLAVPKPTLP